MNTILDKKGGSLFPVSNKQKQHFPLANFHQHPDEYILIVAAPGFERNQFDIVVDKDILSVSAINKKKIKYDKNSQYEYDYSHWHRRFVLPDNAEATMMVSNYINGELIIHIPKQKTSVVHEDVMRVVVY